MKETISQQYDQAANAVASSLVLEVQQVQIIGPQTPFNTESLKDRTGSISDVVEQARRSSVKVAEMPVSGSEAVPINPGKVGVITSGGLNGCHTTIRAGKNLKGESIVAMTHFPPEFGSERYAQAVHELKDEFEQQWVAMDTVFTFVVKTGFPKETEMLCTEFIDAQLYSAEYDSRNPDEKGQDYGKCVAVLDSSGEQAMLSLLTDRGDHQITVEAMKPRAAASD